MNPVTPRADADEVRRNLPPIVASDWPSYNQDVRGWRFNSAENKLSPQNASELEEKWRFPAQSSNETIGVVHATPSVVNGHVYFGTGTAPAFYKLKPDGTLARSIIWSQAHHSRCHCHEVVSTPLMPRMAS